MHKTYLDTYKLLGFTGGDWAYAINTNETSGVPCSPSAEKVVSITERRLAVYLLGWESIEVCPQFAFNAEQPCQLFHIAPSGWVQNCSVCRGDGQIGAVLWAWIWRVVCYV